MQKFKTLLTEVPEPGLLLVTLNRPDKLNAIDTDMLVDLYDLFDMLKKSGDIRVVIITGNGRGFCAGADLLAATEHKDTQFFSDPEHFLELVQERYAGIIENLRYVPQPVIAAINGPAAGGGFCMALGADVRFAAPEAYFVASFINIGLSGGELGTTYFLPRLVGLSRASEILYTGRKVWADEAERIGLVSAVVSRDKLLEEAISCARLMLQKSVGGLKLTKIALRENVDAPSMESAINLENRNQAILVFSKAFFSLVKSFVKKDTKGS